MHAFDGIIECFGVCLLLRFDLLDQFGEVVNLVEEALLDLDELLRVLTCLHFYY